MVFPELRGNFWPQGKFFRWRQTASVLVRWWSSWFEQQRSDKHRMTETAPVGNLPLKVFLLAVISVVVGFLAAGRAHLGTVPGVVIGCAVFGIGVFAVLRLSGVPRELWFTFCLKLFSVTAYKIVTVVL